MMKTETCRELSGSVHRTIVRLEKDQPWGSKFMHRVSADLKAWMPEAKCFSRINLYYMVRFFNLYAPAQIVQQVVEQSHAKPDDAQIVQQVAEQLPLRSFVTDYPNVCRIIFSVPWGHHMVIMDKFGSDQRTALFYVRKTVENGWSRAMLENNMASNLHLRQGKSETNFDSALTDPDSDLAKEMLRDPYDFSFLAMDDKYREEEYALESSALPIGVSDYVLVGITRIFIIAHGGTETRSFFKISHFVVQHALSPVG